MTACFCVFEKLRIIGKTNNPNAICPKTLNQPILFARFFIMVFMGTGSSRMTFKISKSFANPLYINREEIAAPVSITILTLIFFLIKFHNFCHIGALHIVFFFQKLIMLQNFF